MKILTIDFEDILAQSNRFTEYDLILIRSDLSLGSKYESRTFHASVYSRSSTLGILKTLDRYVIEEMGLKPKHFRLKGFGKVFFDFDQNNTFYRVFEETMPLEDGTYETDVYFKVENSPLSAMLEEEHEIIEFTPVKPGTLEDVQELIESITNRKTIGPLKEVKSLENTKDIVSATKGKILLRGPLLGVKGSITQIESLFSYLEKSKLEKVKSYDDYVLTQEEKKLFNRDPNNYAYHESFIKMFLIANELRWLGNVKVEDIRKDYIEWFKSQK